MVEAGRRGPPAKGPPFSERGYTLGRFSLTRLEEAHIEGISRELAGMDPWRTLGYRAEGLARYLSRSDPALFRFAVSAGGDLPAGVLCVRHPWLLGPYIELLALFGPDSGRGAGKAICEWIEAETRESSKNIWAAVSSFNHRALEFYKHRGFFEVAPLRDLIRPGHDEILLRKIVDHKAVDTSRISAI